MRKYSDTFVQKKIDKIDQMREDALNSRSFALPEGLDRYPWIKKSVLEYIKVRSDLSYVNGFWAGWTLKEGDPDFKEEIKSKD